MPAGPSRAQCSFGRLSCPWEARTNSSVGWGRVTDGSSEAMAMVASQSRVVGQVGGWQRAHRRQRPGSGGCEDGRTCRRRQPGRGPGTAKATGTWGLRKGMLPSPGEECPDAGGRALGCISPPPPLPRERGDARTLDTRHHASCLLVALCTTSWA